MRETAWLSETTAPISAKAATTIAAWTQIDILLEENRASSNSTSAQNAALASAISGPPLKALAAVMPELPITSDVATATVAISARNIASAAHSRLVRNACPALASD